ncbi:MAG: LptF/LptG family permease [Armatimonadetes bacterium]|nr:LptF/LptG family permease [Armatimonadota bacterium]
MKLVDRYILREWIAPFVAGTLVFVAVILVNTIIKSSGAIFSLHPPWQVTLKWLAWRLPVVLTVALPVGCMLATSLLTVRLGRDRELLALRLGGMSVRRLFLPFYLAGLLVSLLALLNDEFLAPTAALRANEVFLQRIMQMTGQTIKDSTAFRSGEQSFCHVGKVDLRANVLHFVLIYRLRNGRPFEALCATEAHREGRQWVLHDVRHSWFDERARLAKVAREDRVPVQFADDIVEMWDEDKNPEQLTFRDLRRRVDLLAEAGDSANSQRLRYFLHTKLSLPLTCLIFALLAGPLSLPFAAPERHPFTGVLITVIVIFFCNGTINWAKAIALSGPQAWMSPGLAAWLHVLIFGVLGAFLLRRVEH